MFHLKIYSFLGLSEQFDSSVTSKQLESTGLYLRAVMNHYKPLYDFGNMIFPASSTDPSLLKKEFLGTAQKTNYKSLLEEGRFKSKIIQ